MSAISDCCEKWGDSAEYMPDILISSNWMKLKNPDNIKIYGLTEQLENLDVIKPESILGFADCRTMLCNRTWLSYFQVIPSGMNALLPKYSTPSHKNEADVNRFYKHNGIKQIHSAYFRWRASILEIIKRLIRNNFRFNSGN